MRKQFVTVARRVSGVLLVAIAITSCDDNRPAAAEPSPGPMWTEQTAWRMSNEPVLHIDATGMGLDNVALDPVGIAQLSDGRFIVGDGDQAGRHELLVYDADGRFIERWGGRGEGPGEFGQLYVYVQRLRGDTVAAFDSRNGAFKLFSPEGKYTGEIGRPAPRGYGYGFPFGIFEDGSQVRPTGRDPTDKPKHGRYYIPAQVTVIDRAGLEQHLGTVELPRWVGRDPNFNWQPFGITERVHVGKRKVYFGTGERFEITVFAAGESPVVLARVVDREPIGNSKEELAQFFAGRPSPDGAPPGGMLAFVDNYDFPEYKAAFSAIVEDDDENVWVEHYRWQFPREIGPNPKATIWSVFSPQGAFLGEMVAPPAFVITKITSDRVFGFCQDEWGVDSVCAYALLKP